MISGSRSGFVRRVFSGALAVALFPATAMSILLLIVARDGCSRLFAAGILLLCWAALFMVFRTRGSRWRWFIPAGLLCVAVLTLSLARLTAPKGGPHTAQGLSSIHIGGASAHPLSPASLVSEHDQLRMGSFLLPLLDPHMDSAQARAFRSDFDAVYDDMNQHAGVFDMGSVMSDVYRDISGGGPGAEHYYLYVPQVEGPRPVIIFMHGWLGNFKAYVWKWREFADATGAAILCPSYGAGLWNRPHSEDRIRWALEQCARDERLDTDRVTLVGLSNGAMGVTRAAMAMPGAFQGLIYLSPVIEKNRVGSPAFVQALGDTPILVVSGSNDRRIPKRYVDASLTAMRQGGLNVHGVMVPEQDHFLLLSEFKAVTDSIQNWQAQSHHSRIDN